MIRVPMAHERQNNAVVEMLPARAVSPHATRLDSIEAATLVFGENYDPTEDPLELQLFNNAAEVKILFGDYLRHLSINWRPLIFKEVDRLLDVDAWNEDSSMLMVASFRTFLRFVDHARPRSVPSLGVGHDGSVLAAWISEPLQLYVTFLPYDRVSASFARR